MKIKRELWILIYKIIPNVTFWHLKGGALKQSNVLIGY